MTEFINNIGDEIVNLWEAFNEFIRNNHSNPFLWVGFILGGLAIAMWAFDTLNKDAR